MSELNSLGFVISETTAKDIEFNIVNQHRDFVIAEGIIQEAEQENRNKRCYAREDLFSQVMCPRTQELMRSGNMKGEDGHPMDISLVRQQTIDPKYVQVWYTKLWMDGPFVKAQFRGTNNKYGKEFNLDLLDGQKPSFSLRALGRIENIKGRAYVKGLKIVTWDRVYYPSHNKAYTEKIVSEMKRESAIMEGATSFNPVSQYRTITPPGNQMVMNESFVMPIMTEQIRNYVVSESGNLDIIRKNFDTLYQTINISEDGKMVTIVDTDHNTICIPLERHIQNEIMEFCSKL